jgi:DNA repair protein SbcC/Rad50
MIPLRVLLKGFLCYKDEQEIDFVGSPVWLLTGLNGSGKSSIFDAVTYALFGHHRGGGTDAVELINKDCDSAHVTFEFTLESKPYLIQRTLRRAKQSGVRATQLIHALNSAGKWESVEGTDLQKGFKEWIDQHIGLSYDTFTSSVLLLQGRAERLLDSTAKGRFEVLAGIVDLDRFERLHKRADEARKHLESKAKAGRERLAALPEVSAVELLEAQGKIQSAESHRGAAQAEWDRWRGLEGLAQQWAELQVKLTAARQRVAQTTKTLEEAGAIEANLKRLHELQTALPRLQDFVAARGQIHTAEQMLTELAKQRDKADKDLRALEDKLKLTRSQREQLLEQIKQDEKTLQTTSDEARKLHAQVEKLNEADRGEQDRQRLLEEAKALPANPKEEVRQARDLVQRLDDLKQALGPLTRLHLQRGQLAQALEQETSAATKVTKTRTRGENLRAEVDKLKTQVDEAAAVRQRAEQEATRDRTLGEQAKQQLDDFLATDGAKVCRLCGQALTPSHWKGEKQTRSSELAAAQARADASAALAKETVTKEQALRDQCVELESKLTQAREAYKTQQALAAQLRRDVERLRQDCALAYQELAPPFRDQVAPMLPSDWSTTVFPTPEDLESAATEIATLSAARRSQTQATEQLDQWNALQGRLATVLATLERLRAGLPADARRLREMHARQEAAAKALQEALAARRHQAEETQTQLDRGSVERERLQKQIADFHTQIARQEQTRQDGQQNLQRARKELPAAWQPKADTLGTADVHSMRSELDLLIENRTEERAGELQQARAGLEYQRLEVADLESQETRIPPEARLTLPEVRQRGLDAKKSFQVRDDELAAARRCKDGLEEKHRQRQELHDELLHLDEEVMHAKLLADLLSRNRLQLHLVRQAERQVVDHANAVLDRLSGGQLYLRLAGGAGGEDSDTKALELEAHNRQTGDKPINVAFLSGSQRFRVAVSLALGLGQYASRQHRPLESVIIDEGFGSLDRFGRQLMIQEMQSLRDQVRCILLVSHQEEFADAFSDGYRFELVNGSTVATRFQR